VQITKLSNFSLSVVEQNISTHKLKISHWDFHNTSQIYLWTLVTMESWKGLEFKFLKYTFLKEGIFSSCVKERSYFNYLPNSGWLNFSFCKKLKLHSLTRVLVCLYSFITRHKSIRPTSPQVPAAVHPSPIDQSWEGWASCHTHTHTHTHTYIYIYIYIYTHTYMTFVL
jgi:hypothetical protein